MTTPALFTLGTRGSPLALTQANEARHRSAAAHGWEIETIALQVIRRTGDRIQDRPLADVGGKGLFTKEIDAPLLAGAIDAYLPREDARDALICPYSCAATSRRGSAKRR
jgi:hydroxymethylbilane synthase